MMPVKTAGRMEWYMIPNTGGSGTHRPILIKKGMLKVRGYWHFKIYRAHYGFYADVINPFFLVVSSNSWSNTLAKIIKATTVC